MSPDEKARLIQQHEWLRKLAEELTIQANSFAQSLAELPVKEAKEANIAPSAPVVAEGLPAIMEAMIPSVRSAIRAEIKGIQALNEDWYEPNEVAEMSDGRVSAKTIRNWITWGQIDGESNGRQVRIYKHSVEELRKNKWRALRPPDPAKTPTSRMEMMVPKGRDRKEQKDS